MTSWILRHYHPMWVRAGVIALAVALSVASGQAVALAGEDGGGG